MIQQRILLVDDEKNITDLAQMYLEREGYKTESIHEGLTALDLIRSNPPAVVVLDLMLPGLDGFEICRKLRAENIQVPVILLTARDDDVDKILGLELGADDYMTKPFNPRELVSRVKAILRRVERSSETSGKTIQVGDIVIDLARREVKRMGTLIDLRRHEFELLKVLAENRGFVLSREQLLNLAWGYDFAGQTRTVDVHVGQLRNKLADSIVKIVTITGIGYKLVP
jgi:two-component system, OmpR family, alkaline phosphatase synthesis response regulator PhoP